MTGCYLIQNPRDAYAFRMMERIYERFGHRPICFYTNREARLDANPHTALSSLRLAVSLHDVSPGAILPFVDAMRPRHWLLGAIPYSEESLGLATLINHHLGVSHNSLEVMRRFRDKASLKLHLRSEDPGLRVNHSAIVRGPSEARRTGSRFGHYVLKPNDGFGNRTIGIFSGNTTEAPLSTYFNTVGDAQVVLEEFVGGTEYFINGHVNAAGDVSTFATFAYERVAANGRDNIDYLTRQVHTHEAVFSTLQDYAKRTMQASGLVRSPFHIEVKVDHHGPCLIEVGARLVGNGNAFVTNMLHKGSLDIFDLAVDGYLGGGMAEGRCDWQSYDATSTLYVHGISHSREVLYALDGVDAIEALPEFHSWLGKPRLGDVVVPTVDLFTSPYALLLRGKDPQALQKAAQYVRQALQWNKRVTMAQRLEVEIHRLPARLQRGAERILYAQRLTLPKHDIYA